MREGGWYGSGNSQTIQRISLPQAYLSSPSGFESDHSCPSASVGFVQHCPAHSRYQALPNERQICGEIGIAPYALPGSEQLGENIAAVFKSGIDTVMLENHGVVVGAGDLPQAFNRFETLDFCARLEIEARRIGNPVLLTDEDYDIVRNKSTLQLDTYIRDTCTSEEKKFAGTCAHSCGVRNKQGLFTSTQGTFPIVYWVMILSLHPTAKTATIWSRVISSV